MALFYRMYTLDKPSMLGPPGSVLVSSKLNMQQLHHRAANIPPMVGHHGNLPHGSRQLQWSYLERHGGQEVDPQ